MSGPARVLTALAVACLMVFVGTGVALAATVMAAGVVTVAVADEGPSGSDLVVPVPALALDLGLGIASVAMPAAERDRLRTEVAPYAPALLELADELERMPDATLVEVVTDRESVRVVKQGRGFVVDVDSPDGRVRVGVPAATLSKVVRFLTG